MSEGRHQLPAWQDVSEHVTDNQLYLYLLNLAVIANKQTEAADAQKLEDANNAREELGKDSAVVSKLPKGTIKALMTYFKQLALDKQPEPVDPALKRAYLAFYAQLLELKSQQPGELEEFGTTAELLIAKFLSIVSKVSGSPNVSSQGGQFVALLRNVARKNGGTAALDAQLAARQQKFSQTSPSKTPKKKIMRSVSTNKIAEQVSRIMLVSPTLFERDLAPKQNLSLNDLAFVVIQLDRALSSQQHPIYQYSDFGSEIAWEQFAQREKAQLAEVLASLPSSPSSSSNPPDLIPDNVRAYFTLLLKRCIEADKKAEGLLAANTKLLVQFVAKYWRVSSTAYVSCLLHAVNDLFKSDLLTTVDVDEAYEFAKGMLAVDVVQPLPNGKWPLSDIFIARDAMHQLRLLLLAQLKSSLMLLFTPKMPKLGPVLQLLQITIPSFFVALKADDSRLAQGGGGGSDASLQEITDLQIQELTETLEDVAEQEYIHFASHLPRDVLVDVTPILEFIQSIITTYQKLQKKYKNPLLNRISIPKVVLKSQLLLLRNDFNDIWDFCESQFKARNEEIPFDSMVELLENMSVLRDLYTQLKLGKPLKTQEVEDKFSGYFCAWAEESAKLFREWVTPIIEQDDSKPIDRDNGKMYSSAVKDLFSSFYSSISLVEKLHLPNERHNAELLTLMVEGCSNALCDWANRMFVAFLREIKPAVQKHRLKPKEQDEQWLAYAKEATAQATAAMMAARQPVAPEPFEFKPESGVKLNNISEAYDLLHRMEANLRTDDIAQQLSTQLQTSARTGLKARGTSYLCTLTVISATDVKQSEGGLYVTLVDQDTRKQLGKTSTAFGTSRSSTWNEPIELEVRAGSPRLIRATLWSENQKNDHDLCGRAMIGIDPSQFARREYGTQVKWIDLESGTGKLQVMLTIDLMHRDIRFYFGKGLRYLKRTQDGMVDAIVKQFSGHIYAVLSRQTLRDVTGAGSLATSVQSSVNQLQKSFSNWLNKSSAAAEKSQPQVLEPEKAADEALVPLYDYFNKNFATLAETLTPELRIEVLSRTWDIVLEALELLIIPPLEARQTPQTQLSSLEMETVYAWLSSLREFFHSDGAGPSLERLQSQGYQLIMAIPVYYDLPAAELKVECEKVVRSSLRTMTGNQKLAARQKSVMAHRNKSIIEHQAKQLRTAQRTSPQLDDIILRVLRLRGEYAFIEQHLKYRERLLQREMTEKALQGFMS